MSEYSLYKVELPKPYLMLKLQSRGYLKEWFIPEYKELDFRNYKRIAFESPAPGYEAEGIFQGPMEKFDAGKFELRSDTKFKIEFRIESTVRSNGLYGNYVIMVPSWGRKTLRRTWVLIPA